MKQKKEESKFEFELKQPKDFDNIQNSLELVQALDTVKKAEYKIQMYKETFVESFLKTAEEVVQYIPEKQLDKYILCDKYIRMFNKPIISTFGLSESAMEYSDKVKKIFEDDKKANDRWHHKVHVKGEKYFSPPHISKEDAEIIKSEVRHYNENFTDIEKCETLLEKLRWINPKQKVFLVDTVNKKIEVMWGLEDPVDMHPLNCFRKDSFFGNDISKRIEGEIIISTCKFYYTYYYETRAAGAVRISTGNGNGYWSKTESVKSTDTKRISHKFNMRNNKYEGIIKNDFIDGNRS